MITVNWGGVNGKAFSMTVSTLEEQKEWQTIIKYCRGKRARRAENERHKIEWRLDHFDVKTLLDEAGITIFDVGQQKGKYQLSRYEDKGHYEVGNCRFITKEENLAEYWNNPEVWGKYEKHKHKLKL